MSHEKKKTYYFSLNPGWLIPGSLCHGLWNNPYIYIYLGSGFHPLYNPTKTRGQFFHGSSVSTPPIYRITGIPQKAFASGMRRKTPLPTPCSAPFWRLPTSPFLAPRLGFCWKLREFQGWMCWWVQRTKCIEYLRILTKRWIDLLIVN